MPLTITINEGNVPTPQSVKPAIVVHKAKNNGHPDASKALAITLPFINVDQRGLNYDLRLKGGQKEFRFSTGVLLLTLRQDIYIANDLTACHQTNWRQHEQDHVGTFWGHNT